MGSTLLYLVFVHINQGSLAIYTCPCIYLNNAMQYRQHEDSIVMYWFETGATGADLQCASYNKNLAKANGKGLDNSTCYTWVRLETHSPEYQLQRFSSVCPPLPVPNLSFQDGFSILMDSNRLVTNLRGSVTDTAIGVNVTSCDSWIWYDLYLYTVARTNVSEILN